jgi:hypothetical protein
VFQTVLHPEEVENMHEEMPQVRHAYRYEPAKCPLKRTYVEYRNMISIVFAPHWCDMST